MVEQNESVNLDAYKAMYEYFQKQLEHEKNRLKNFEDKATKFITMISIIITAYTFIITNFVSKNRDLANLDKPSQVFTIIMLVLFIFLFLSLGKAWICLLNTFRLKQTVHMPSNQETIDLFINYSNNLHDVYHFLSDKIIEVIEAYKKANDSKINLLSKADTYISVSAYLFAMIVPLSAIYKYVI